MSLNTPKNPHIPLFIEAVRATLGGQATLAEHQLIRLQVKTVLGAPDTGRVPLRIRLAVFNRDQFSCRYCHRQTVFMPVLVALSLKYPMTFPFSGPNPEGHSHGSFWRDIPVCDYQLLPENGGSVDPGNIATACYACYQAKKKFPDPQRWKPRPAAGQKWNGLHDKLYDLAVLTKMTAEPYFFEWLKIIKGDI